MGAVSSSLYKGHRYPGEIISHCVWLYHRFPLSFREVEEMMLAAQRHWTKPVVLGFALLLHHPMYDQRTDDAVNGRRLQIEPIGDFAEAHRLAALRLEQNAESAVD